jgi:hypothetical protein
LEGLYFCPFISHRDKNWNRASDVNDGEHH